MVIEFLLDNFLIKKHWLIYCPISNEKEFVEKIPNNTSNNFPLIFQKRGYAYQNVKYFEHDQENKHTNYQVAAVFGASGT